MQACNEKDPTKSPYEDVLQSLIEEGAPGTTLVGIPLEEAGPERMAREVSPLPQPEVRGKIYDDVKHALREEGLCTGISVALRKLREIPLFSARIVKNIGGAIDEFFDFAVGTIVIIVIICVIILVVTRRMTLEGLIDLLSKLLVQ